MHRDRRQPATVHSTGEGFEFETFLKSLDEEVELVGLEPTASAMPLQRSSN